MSHLTKTFVIAGLTLFIVSLLPQTVFGKDEIKASISVSPVKIEPVLDKGSTYTAEIRIVNTAKQKARLSLSVKDFSKTDDGGYRFYAPGSRSATFSAANWIRLPNGKEMLDPGGKVNIPLTIEVPKNAEAGTHYAMCFVSAEPVFETEAVKRSYVIGIARIGCLVLVTVKGKTVRKSDVTFTVNRFNVSQTIPFSIRFRNKGNVHRDVIGSVTIDQPRQNRKIEERPSLPESTTAVNGSFKNLPLAGKFRATMRLRTRDGGLWTREQTFYVVPVKQIAAAVLIMSLIVFVVSFFRGRFSIKLERKDQTNT